MPSITVQTLSGATSNGKAGEGPSVELAADVFGVQPNVPVMHQVVTAQLAHRRAGTQSTKTRAEVSGGGKKPFKQKGTGNARQGSTRAPHFSGGGVALGPKPRKYSQKTPKKMIKLALRSALSDRANEGKIIVVDNWGFDAPSTKTAVAALGALGITGSVLVVHGREEIALVKSFRNLQNVQLIEAGELNAYDVLCNETIVFTSANLPNGAAADGEPMQVAAETPPVEEVETVLVAETVVQEELASEQEGAGEADAIEGDAIEGDAIEGDAIEGDASEEQDES